MINSHLNRTALYWALLWRIFQMGKLLGELATFSFIVKGARIYDPIHHAKSFMFVPVTLWEMYESLQKQIGSLSNYVVSIWNGFFGVCAPSF